MSDSFETVVVYDVSLDKAEALKNDAVRWLADRGIVEAAPSASVLSLDTLGYAPGPRAEEVCQLPSNWDDSRRGLWRELQVNGVELQTGGIIACGMDCEFELKCANCGSMQPITGDELSEWQSTASAALSCEACGAVAVLDQWDGGDQWAFGRFALTFWNWPPLKAETVRDFGLALGGRKARSIHGRV